MAPSKSAPTLKQLAAKDPAKLGDPVSLRTGTSSTSPTENDRPNKADSARDGSASAPKTSASASGQTSSDGEIKGGESKTLKQVAQNTNASQLGDPVSLKAETVDSEPTEEDRPVTGGKRGSKL